MKCPHCSKEIKEDALFCGYCGKQLPQIEAESAAIAPAEKEINHDEIAPVPDELQVEATANMIPTEETTVNKKPKQRRIALKVFLLFLLIAFVSGSLLGFLTTRGVITLDYLKTNSHFEWLSLMDGEAEVVEP